MEKRKVTILVGGEYCSFYSDDPEEYLSALEQRANQVMRQTAKYSGASAQTNAVLSVIYQTDALMRLEKEKTRAAEEPAEIRKPRKNAAQTSAEDQGQVSVWELLGNGKEKEI